MRVEDLFRWMQERWRIRVKRLTAAPKPWTTDVILQRYRFCNVYREDDTVTQWIATNWRKPHRNHPDLWFAMMIARFINWPVTLAHVGNPLEHHNGDVLGWLTYFESVVEHLQRAGQQVYSGAYMVRSDPGAKHTYLARTVWQKAYEQRGYIQEQMRGRGATLAALHSDLTSFNGLGSFMAGQIVADVKYAQMKKAPDWWTFAAPGPGSMRGLNRVVGDDKDKRWTADQWKATHDILYERIAQMCAAALMPRLHAQDLQNCLCEFDKYERVRLGEGRPRSLYPGV